MWEQALLQLADRVEAFAQAEGLSFERVGGVLEPGETYASIEGRHRNTLHLEPSEFAGREVPATVWLYSYPTMRRVRLVGPDAVGEATLSTAGPDPLSAVHRHVLC